MPVIGFLHGASPTPCAHDCLIPPRTAEAGYVEGQNVTIDYRWAEGHFDRLPALAADVVRRQVAVIFAGSLPAALAAKVATTDNSDCFHRRGDPVKDGLVASLNRPGSNVTG